MSTSEIVNGYVVARENDAEGTYLGEHGAFFATDIQGAYVFALEQLRGLSKPEKWVNQPMAVYRATFDSLRHEVSLKEELQPNEVRQLLGWTLIGVDNPHYL